MDKWSQSELFNDGLFSVTGAEEFGYLLGFGFFGTIAEHWHFMAID